MGTSRSEGARGSGAAAVFAVVFAVATLLLTGCTGTPDDAPDEAPDAPENTDPPATATSDPSGSSTASPSAQLPALGLELQAKLVDPDPNSAGEFTGPITENRLISEELLGGADIDCLTSNGFTLSYIKDGAATSPNQVTWVFELGSAEGATNCADQMRRSDGSSGTLTDRSAALGVADDVVAYSMTVSSGGETITVARALYTNDKYLFRVTTSQVGVSYEQFEPPFRDLLENQLDLTAAD